MQAAADNESAFSCKRQGGFATYAAACACDDAYFSGKSL